MASTLAKLYVLSEKICDSLLSILGFFATKEELYYMIAGYIKHITGTLNYKIVPTL